MSSVKRYKMMFPATTLGEPFMYKMSRDMNVIPNIVKGRISDEQAWLDIEIEGQDGDIEIALEYLQSKGVVIENPDS